MQPPERDIASRRPVWDALSRLYLDTEMSADDLALLATQLAASPYTADELECVLLIEVHPICIGNLRRVAGIWSGFDSDWLQDRILRRRRLWFRWPARCFPLRGQVLSRMAPLFARVAELRRAPGSI